MLALAIAWQLVGDPHSREQTREQGRPSAATVPTREVAAIEAPSEGTGRANVPEPERLAGFMVRVTDPKGEPLAGCEVHVRSSAGWRHFGLTDSGGELALRPPAATGSMVAARHAGYVPAKALISEPFPAEVVLILTPTAPICGRVLTASGVAPTPGVRVVALARGVLDHEQVLGGLFENDPTVVSADVDAAGAFCVDGLAGGAEYMLFAAGAGYVMVQPPVALAKTGDISIELTVSRLFGVLVHFVPESGPLESLLPKHGHRRLESSCAGADHFGMRWCAWLSGLDPALRELPAGFLLQLYTSDTLGDELGPLVLDYEFAGYERGRAELTCTPVDKGVASATLPLRRLGTRLGALEIEFRSPSWRTSGDAGPHPSTGQVQLIDGDVLPLRFEFEVDRQGRARVEGVPFGGYTWTVHATGLRYPSPSGPTQHVEIGEHPTTIVVDLTARAALALDLRNPDGSSYSGAVMVFLSHGTPTPDASGRVRQSGALSSGMSPPFEVSGLEPGIYTLRLLSPTFTSLDGERRIVVDLPAGEKTTVVARRAE